MIMADKTRLEYKLIGTQFSTKERDLRRFEEMITDHLNKGFKLQGEPFFVESLMYQPMTREVKVVDPIPTSATQTPSPRSALK
jgi:hypothetical protein